MIIKLVPLISTCVDRLIETMSKLANDKEVNIYMLLKKFTMDSIWNCAFGVDVDFQRNESDYFSKCETIFRNFEKLNIFSFVGGNNL